MVDRIAEWTIEIMTIDIMITIEVGIGSRQRPFSENYSGNRISSTSSSRSRSGSRASTNRDRIR